MAARDERVVTAYHEAGHAVMAWACGIAVSTVTIVPNDQTLGMVKLTFSQQQKDALAKADEWIFRSMVIVGLGGIAADYNLWKRDPYAKPDEVPKGHFQDQHQVRQRLQGLGHNCPTDMDAYLGCTVRFLDTSQGWDMVERVAQALLALSELDTTLIEELANRTPKIDQLFWDKIHMAMQVFREEEASGK